MVFKLASLLFGGLSLGSILTTAYIAAFGVSQGLLINAITGGKADVAGYFGVVSANAWYRGANQPTVYKIGHGVQIVAQDVLSISKTATNYVLDGAFQLSQYVLLPESANARRKMFKKNSVFTKAQYQKLPYSGTFTKYQRQATQIQKQFGVYVPRQIILQAQYLAKQRILKQYAEDRLNPQQFAELRANLVQQQFHKLMRLQARKLNQLKGFQPSADVKFVLDVFGAQFRASHFSQKFIKQQAQQRKKFQQQDYIWRVIYINSALLGVTIAEERKIIQFQQLWRTFVRFTMAIYRKIMKITPPDVARRMLIKSIESSSKFLGVSPQQLEREIQQINSLTNEQLSQQSYFQKSIQRYFKGVLSDQKFKKMPLKEGAQYLNKLVDHQMQDHFFVKDPKQKKKLKQFMYRTVDGQLDSAQTLYNKLLRESQNEGLTLSQAITSVLTITTPKQIRKRQVETDYIRKIQQLNWRVGKGQRGDIGIFTSDYGHNSNRFNFYYPHENSRQAIIKNQLRRIQQVMKKGAVDAAKSKVIAETFTTREDPNKKVRLNTEQLDTKYSTQFTINVPANQPFRPAESWARTKSFLRKLNILETPDTETRTQQLKYYISDNGFAPQILANILAKKLSVVQKTVADNFRMITQVAREKIKKYQKEAAFFNKKQTILPQQPSWLNYANLQTQKISNQNTLSSQVQQMFNYILMTIFTQVFLNNLQGAQVLGFIQSVSIIHPMMTMVECYQYAASIFASQRAYSQTLMNVQLIQGQQPTLQYRPTFVYVWDQVFIYMQAIASPFIMQMSGKLQMSMQFQIDFSKRLIISCTILILGKKYPYKLDDTGVLWKIAQQVVRTKYSFTQQLYKNTGRS